MWSLLLACSPRAPSAEVGAARLTGVGWDALTGEVDLVVDNPLWVEVPVERASWSLAVAGRELAGGAVATTPLAADGRTTWTVPVTLAWSELAEVLGGGEGWAAPWTLSGSASLRTPAGPLQLPLERTLWLPRIAPPRLDDLAVRADGLAWVVDVTLDTPALAGFALGTVGWRAELAGVAVGTGSAAPGAGDGPRRRTRLLTRGALSDALRAALSWGAGRRELGFAVAGAVQTPLGEVPFSAHPTLAW